MSAKLKVSTVVFMKQRLVSGYLAARPSARPRCSSHRIIPKAVRSEWPWSSARGSSPSCCSANVPGALFQRLWPEQPCPEKFGTRTVRRLLVKQCPATRRDFERCGWSPGLIQIGRLFQRKPLIHHAVEKEQRAIRRFTERDKTHGRRDRHQLGSDDNTFQTRHDQLLPICDRGIE